MARQGAASDGERFKEPAEGRGGTQGRGDQATEAESRRTGFGFRHREGGDEGAPYGAEDVRRVRQTLSKVSLRRACRVLEVSRTALRPRKPSPESRRSMDELL